MSKEDDIVHLLLLTETQNEGEQLVSLLRNRGLATRAHHISSGEDLESNLKSRDWDLLLAQSEAHGMTAQGCIEAIRKGGRQFPMIILSPAADSDTITAGLRLGASDVVPAGEDERLSLVIQRELAGLADRKRRIRAENSLEEIDKRCQLLLHSSRDAISYVHDGMHIYANETYMEMFGYEDPEELECTPLVDLIKPDSLDKLKERLKKVSTGGSMEEEFDCGCVNAAGNEFSGRMFLSPARYDGEACTQVLIRTSSVDSAEFEERLKEATSQDPLTGLFNRPYFNGEIEKAVEKAKAGSENFALLYVGIDQFDKTRAEMGMAAGDRILKQIGDILQKICGSDKLIARFADDVFTAMVPCEDGVKAVELGRNIQQTIAENLFEVQDKTARATASVGVSIIDKLTPSANEAVTRAHSAVEKVRDTSGGNGVHLYDPAKDSGAGGSVSQVEKLQRAVEGERFKVMFQPVISLMGETEEIYEATMRMLEEDSDDELPPGKFLEIAAEAGLGAQIDRWATLNCIKTLAGHRARGHETTLFINLTHASLTDGTFADWVAKAVKASRLPPECLVYQFREMEVVNYLKKGKETLNAIRNIGCRICLKHFQGSDASFDLFNHFGSDFIKIDGSFTRAMEKPEGKEEMRELVKKLQELEKTVIVPMVENANMIPTLFSAGVKFIQGYYFQAPMDSMDFNFAGEES